jgi:hypothetical protein
MLVDIKKAQILEENSKSGNKPPGYFRHMYLDRFDIT